MNAKLTETLRLDMPIPPGAFTSGVAQTGRGVSLAEYDRVLFVLLVGALAASKTAELKIRQDKAEAATAAIKDITTALSEVEGEVETNTTILRGNLALDTVVEGNVVTINGVVFEAVDTNPDIDAGEWATGASDTAAAANLAAAINHVLGPAVQAIASTDNVALHAVEAPVTIASPSSTITATTLAAAVALEIKAAELDRANEFTHAVPVAEVDDTASMAVLAIRGYARRIPVQVLAGLV